MTDEPTPTASDVRAAAEALKSAIDAHLAAVERSTGEGDLSVQESYDALHRKSETYDDLLFDVYDEVTPWEYAKAPELGDAAAEGELRRFALLLRRDYTLDDADSLLAAGHEAYTEVWPQEQEGTINGDVATPARAIYQLIHAYGPDGLAERAERAGLRPHGGSVWVQAVSEDDDSLDADDPFAISDEDALIYRLDEVYED